MKRYHLYKYMINIFKNIRLIYHICPDLKPEQVGLKRAKDFIFYFDKEYYLVLHSAYHQIFKKTSNHKKFVVVHNMIWLNYLKITIPFGTGLKVSFVIIKKRIYFWISQNSAIVWRFCKNCLLAHNLVKITSQ